MGLLDWLRAGWARPPSSALKAYLEEVATLHGGVCFDPAVTPAGLKLLEASPDECAATIVEVWAAARQIQENHLAIQEVHYVLRPLLVVLQRRRPPLSTEQLAAAVGHAAVSCASSGWTALSLGALVAACEPPMEKERPAALVEALTSLHAALAKSTTADDVRTATRLQELLDGSWALPLKVTGAFSRRVTEDLAGLSAPLRQSWTALLAHGRTADGAKPTARWSRGARPLLTSLGADAATRGASWLEMGPCPGEPAGTVLGEREADLVKALVFIVGALGDPALAPALANMAAASLRKVPNVGPVSARVGNACINVLAELPGGVAITQLGRLRLLVKYATAQRLVERALAAAATRAGVSRAEIEELSLPTYDLDPGGVHRQALGTFTAQITARDDEVTLGFLDVNGRVLKAIPVAVKQDHAPALAQLRRTVKEIAQVLPAQRLRLEELMLARRSMSPENWRARYLFHPLIGDLARRLIWSVETTGRVQLTMAVEGQLLDEQDRPVGELAPDAQVSLFHPLGTSPARVLDWRRFLERHGITQPFKQAHREVYLLTDAERLTATYSNRFAAHVLRQHQLAALCRERGWQYRLQGNFDSGNNPTRHLPGADLTAEFWIEVPQIDQGASAAGIFLQVATDQVRFSRASAPIPLEEVPPLVFSEVMRDVDLFVGVTSIGADPTWSDRGEQPHWEYWRTFAFGELTESARTRREVLEAVIPKLKIGARCSFDERHLVVRGDLATYRIHLGSGNVLIEPGSRYLCIVPSGKKAGPAVVLPFRGDSTLAIILSKAFLLADDGRITDPSITRQIRPG